MATPARPATACTLAEAYPPSASCSSAAETIRSRVSALRASVRSVGRYGMCSQRRSESRFILVCKGSGAAAELSGRTDPGLRGRRGPRVAAWAPAKAALSLALDRAQVWIEVDLDRVARR